ncbi:MAG: SGNH/GDSL hydrolase family protein [Rivularia sp. (in: cyanobacteria)]
MKKVLTAAGFVLFSFILSPKAMARDDFSQFYVFGDSLSDTGNIFAASSFSDPGNPIPPSPPYSQGRFSNGDIWVNFVGDDIGLTPTLIPPPGNTTIPTDGINFAIGGSSSGLGNALNPDSGLPGVLGQVGSFTQILQANNQQADPNALYAVWGGANDYVFGGVTDTSQTVENLSNAIALLTQAGAKNIAVFNLPDLGQLPRPIAENTSAELTQLTEDHNAALEQALGGFSVIPDVNIIPIDVNSLFKRVVANPGEFGFTENPATSCVVGDIGSITSVCNNPNEFVFFDSVHPSSKSHRLVADLTLSAIKHETVPEPSTVFSTLVVGAVGTVGALKRKRQRLSR